MKKTDLQSIPIERLQRGRYQSRTQFSPEELDELAQSIRTNGLLQPIVVRPVSEKVYEIIAGERRWRAAQVAGLSEIDCLVKEMSDEMAAQATIIENLQREDINPIDEANAFKRLLDEFDYTHEELAHLLGKTRTKIANSVRLLNLDKLVQALLIEKTLSEGHGKVLASLSEGLQRKFAIHCVENHWSVRQLEQAIKKEAAALEKPAKPSAKDKDILRLESRLADHLGSVVTFEEAEGKTKMVIDYGNNLDILQGILEKMGFKYDES